MIYIGVDIPALPLSPLKNKRYYEHTINYNMMIDTARKHFTTLLIALLSIVSFTACEDDYYYAPNVVGTWRIVEVTGNSLYREGDVWHFDDNGDFDALGYGGLREYGVWDYDSYRNMLYIGFGAPEPEIEAIVRRYDGQYMSLAVFDYADRREYILRMVRESYFSPKK